MNARGAERGGRMIGAYIGMWPNDHGFGMADADTAGPAADLIADVLHASVSLGLDVDDVLRLARAHFDSEVRHESVDADAPHGRCGCGKPLDGHGEHPGGYGASCGDEDGAERCRSCGEGTYVFDRDTCATRCDRCGAEPSTEGGGRLTER